MANNWPSGYASRVIKVVSGTTNPAANTECSETVPAGKYWKLLSVSVSCVQGNTQTPWPSLVITDGTNTVYQAFSGTAAQSADTTTQHTWARGLSPVGSGASTANLGPLPNDDDFVLGPGYVVSTSTTGKGANTNYGAPTILVIEYS